MKRLFLAAVALSVLAMPAAQAGTRTTMKTQQHSVQHNAQNRHVDVRKKTVVRKKVVVRKNVEKSHWRRGNRVPDWQRRHEVRDYGRHGLRHPARGQRWVKVGNDYLLISITSGIIASLIAGH